MIEREGDYANDVLIKLFGKVQVRELTNKFGGCNSRGEWSRDGHRAAEKGEVSKDTSCKDYGWFGVSSKRHVQ